MRSLIKTKYQKEQFIELIAKLMKPIGIVFTVFAILPVILLFLFSFRILPTKGLVDEKIEAAVARINTNRGTGTAFLISPTRMLTARHVVEGMAVGDEVDIVFEKADNQPTYKGKVLFYPPASTTASAAGTVDLNYFMQDFALIEVPEITMIDPLIIGDSKLVNNLDEVITIGFPLGDYSITQGNINSTSYQGKDLFKLDAASNPGNSGGPCLYKIDQTVIGILVGGGGQHDLQGENVAVKIHNVIDFMKANGIKF